MVRTQLYLPENLYKTLKSKAKKKKMTFASFIRIYLEDEFTEEEKKKSLLQAYPFMKYVGLVKGDGTCNTNEDIDKFLYDEELTKQ